MSVRQKEKRDTMKMKGLLHVAFAYLVTLGVPWATLQVLGKTPVWDMFWAGLALFWGDGSA